MMELAGFHLASLIRKKLKGSVTNQRIVILVGKGNNGGGGLVAARLLNNWGGIVEVIQSHARLVTLEHLHVQIDVIQEQRQLVQQLSKASMIVDALIGYNLKDAPRSPLSDMIVSANKSQRIIISLDLPSGLDATTGIQYSPCIKASSTLTLALLKQGLTVPTAREVIGELYLADIGIPSRVYRELGYNIVNPFTKSSLIRIF